MAPKPNISLELLTESHGSEKAETYYKEKIVQRPLYLKPTPRDESAPNARDLRQQNREKEKLRKRRSPGKPRPLSAKKKRALRIYDIPKEQQKYDIYLPLHRMWCGYMREILNLDKPDSPYGRYVEAKNAGPFLTSADYHGAILEVVRSACVVRVGLKGIVVRDTMLTFEIITEKNKLKTIPKEHTVFRFELPLEDEAGPEASTTSTTLRPLVFELQGSNFEHRATDRATRKYVLHMPPDL